VVLLYRVLIRDPFSSQANPFQDVFFGAKFYGSAAHFTMTIEAIIYAALGIGILLPLKAGCAACGFVNLPRRGSAANAARR
jgi:hypothetical protein